MPFGKYELQEVLGEGSFGVVYKALDLVLDRTVAIKVLHPSLVRQHGLFERFKHEARLAAQLSHPNIVPIYDFGQHEGQNFIAMGYMPGGSLRDLLQKKAPLDEKEAYAIFNELINGVAYAHSKAIVHRDLKPSNILFDEEGRARISDMGFAKTIRVEDSQSLSLSGGIVGTPHYMSPELWEGKSLTHAVDQYSLGCILYEMLSGEKLFDGDTTPTIMMKHFKPIDLRAPLTPESASIITRMTEKEPNARFASLVEVRERLHPSPKKVGEIAENKEIVEVNPKEVEYRFRRSWGGEGGQLFYPKAIEVDSVGILIVADSGEERIMIINQFGGRSVRSFGGYGEEPGKFYGLMDVALASDGTIFTIESSNSRVQHFTRGGWLIKTWGGSDSEPGRFKYPNRIAASRDGFIYVVDDYGSRIQKFSYEGEFLLSWGETGQFEVIEDIAVDNSGFVFLANSGSKRIQKFDRFGNFVLAWTVDDPRHITVNKDGNLLVVDNRYEIKLFSPEGEFLGLSISQSNNRGFYSGLTVDSNYAIYTSSMEYGEINKYSSDGVLVNKWGNRDTPAGKLLGPYSAVFTSTGNLLVLEDENDRVQELSRYGTPKMMFGQRGDGEGEFNSPKDIALDKAGHIYVADCFNHRIQVFNPNGAFVRAFEIVKKEGELSPISIAIDSKGDIYVVVKKRCQKYTNAGIFKKSWNIGDPGSIYIDLADNLYVLSKYIKQYDLEGNYVRSIGESQLSSPEGMFITPNGNIYVAEFWENRILVLDSDGTYLNSFGTSGNLPGQLYEPTDVLVAENGDVYVVDSGNHRIQVFSPQAIQPDSYSGLVQNGGFEKEPALMEWTTGGDLTVARTNNSYQGNYGMRLGQPVAQKEQGQGEAWAYTNFYVDPNWSRPVLKFKYRMFVNDTLDNADVFVAIQDGAGLCHLETVLWVGYKPSKPNEAPTPGQDLGWRSVSFDISKYKGQHIRVNFSNRNLWPKSRGIWTDIDDVMVWDEDQLTM